MEIVNVSDSTGANEFGQSGRGAGVSKSRWWFWTSVFRWLWGILHHCRGRHHLVSCIIAQQQFEHRLEQIQRQNQASVVRHQSYLRRLKVTNLPSKKLSSLSNLAELSEAKQETKISRKRTPSI